VIASAKTEGGTGNKMQMQNEEYTLSSHEVEPFLYKACVVNFIDISHKVILLRWRKNSIVEINRRVDGRRVVRCFGPRDGREFPYGVGLVNPAVGQIGIVLMSV
jgi:hypothetical protein